MAPEATSTVLNTIDILTPNDGKDDELFYVVDLSSILSLDPLVIKKISLPPGTRSIPIAHSSSDYFVYVLSGSGSCWYNGASYEMGTNDCVGFKGGSGVAYAFINEGDSFAPLDVLILGEKKDDDKVFYPLPSQEESSWEDPPPVELGPHNGRPKRPRQDTPTTPELSFDNPAPSEFWPSTIFHSLVMSIPNNLPEPDSYEIAHLSIMSGLTTSFTVSQIVLPPGSRSSSPLAHSKEHHFFCIVEGECHLWEDGKVVPLNEGDCVGFRAGTGIAHCILNNGSKDVIFIEFGQDLEDDQITYPFGGETERKLVEELGRTWWDDAPRRTLGDQKPFPELEN